MIKKQTNIGESTGGSFRAVGLTKYKLVVTISPYDFSGYASNGKLVIDMLQSELLSIMSTAGLADPSVYIRRHGVSCDPAFGLMGIGYRWNTGKRHYEAVEENVTGYYPKIMDLITSHVRTRLAQYKGFDQTLAEYEEANA